MSRDGDRYYEIDGEKYSSVTTNLSVIDKSGALIPWAVNQEREAIKRAFFSVSQDDYMWNDVIDRLGDQKEYIKKSNEAKNIGSKAHDWIEWYTKQVLLGQRSELEMKEPEIPPESRIAIDAWLRWVIDWQFVPLEAEQTVCSKVRGYAGTKDFRASVKIPPGFSDKHTEGPVVALGDYKTGKRIYPEAYLQNVAYRYADREMGNESQIGLIVRLPKTEEDPNFEVKIVPEWGTLDEMIEDFMAVKRTWEWTRRKFQ